MDKVTTFKVFYDAEDDELAQHRIDAKTLSISIGAMADLVTKADHNLNGGRDTVKLLVTTPAAPGSMGVVYSMVELVPNAVDVAKAIGLTGLAAVGIGAPAISLIRQLGSRKVISITKRVGTNQSVLELDGEEIVCSDEVARLVTDPDIRQALVNVVRAPLDGKDSQVFKILDESGQEIVRLEGEETEEVKPLPRGTLLEKEVAVEEVNVRFVQVNFEGNKGWRIDHLGEEHAVSLDDEAFLVQVRNAGVRFSKEDLYVVELETSKTFTARKITYRYAIKKVKNKRPA